MRRMYSKPQLLEAVEQEAKTNGIKVFEDIKDKDGHPRFIEGDIELNASLPSGVTKTYGKWSLSGSHLMIVVAGNFANTTAVPYGSFCEINLPKWVKDKIIPTYQNCVFFTTQQAFASDGTTQNFIVRLVKDSNNTVYISNSAETLTKDRSFRWSFDLLIDNE